MRASETTVGDSALASVMLWRHAPGPRTAAAYCRYRLSFLSRGRHQAKPPMILAFTLRAIAPLGPVCERDAAPKRSRYLGHENIHDLVEIATKISSNIHTSPDYMWYD